jgi:hypothetical protein
VKVAAARTAIVWVIGEYREKIPKLAPDALRKLAKSFCDEDDAVKMQTLNLAVKLFLSDPTHTSLLFKVFALHALSLSFSFSLSPPSIAGSSWGLGIDL